MMNEITAILSERSGRLTTMDIWSALRRRGVNVAKADVEPILRKMADSKLVQFDPPGWRLATGGRISKSVEPPPGLHHTTSALRNIEQTPKPTVSNLGNSTRSQSAPPRKETKTLRAASNTKRWAKFRDLARYYQDCILMEDSPDLKGYLPSINQQWLPISGRIPWNTLAAKGPGFRLGLTTEQGVFQRERGRRGEDMCLYIGYPVRLVKPTKKDVDPFVVPVFVQAVEADWQIESISVRPDGPAQLNSAWIQSAFPTSGEQEAFQRMVGLSSDIGDEDDEDARVSAVAPSIAELGIKMGIYMSDKVQGRINPDALDDSVDYKKLPEGIHNRAVLMLGPRLKFTKSLMRELRTISEEWEDEQLDQTALRFVFPHDLPEDQGEHWPWSPTPKGLPPSAVLTKNSLFGEQHNAVESALSLPLCVITGPPGTGKSEVVRSIMANQLVRSRPTLMASKNHAAIDAVVPALNQLGDGEPLVVRTSSPDLASRNDWKEQMKRLLSRPEVDRSDRVEALIERCAQSAAILSQSAQATQQRIGWEGRYDAAAMALSNAAEQVDANAFINDQATFQWGSDQDAALLDLLNALRIQTHKTAWQRILLWLRITKAIDVKDQVQRAVARLPRLRDEGASVEPIHWENLAKLAKRKAESAAIEDALRNITKNISNEEVSKASATMSESMSDLLGCLSGGNSSRMSFGQRTTLHNLRAGIATFGEKKFRSALHKNIAPLLAAFPLWAVTNLSVRSSIPLVPGIFDLVVIDEASQCDIASIIPLLARSRRATIVGDPMQLKHISRLPPQTDAQLLHRHNLTDISIQRCSHRQNSAFDLASSSPNISGRILLNVHLRCHDDIASYSGETFYRGSLQYGTDTSRFKLPKKMRAGIHWTEVNGPIEGASSGATSPSEIDACLKILKNLEQLDFNGTVGVVTPFRQQANRIGDRIEKDISPQIASRWNLIASTSHGFQGAERDLIIYSLCSGPDLAPTSAGWLSSEDGRCLVNVAVTRAKAMLHIVGNKAWATQCGIPHLEKLAKWNERKPLEEGPKYESIWEERLDTALKEAGITTVPQYRVAHRRLDLAIFAPVKIDIEVDGESFHRTASGRRKDDDHWRDVQISSLGWRVMRFWVYELREDMQGCVGKILEALS